MDTSNFSKRIRLHKPVSSSKGVMSDKAVYVTKLQIVERS